MSPKCFLNILQVNQFKLSGLVVKVNAVIISSIFAFPCSTTYGQAFVEELRRDYGFEHRFILIRLSLHEFLFTIIGKSQGSKESGIACFHSDTLRSIISRELLNKTFLFDLHLKKISIKSNLIRLAYRKRFFTNNVLRDYFSSIVFF